MVEVQIALWVTEHACEAALLDQLVEVVVRELGRIDASLHAYIHLLAHGLPVWAFLLESRHPIGVERRHIEWFTSALVKVGASRLESIAQVE